jgi:hypothetical protein
MIAVGIADPVPATGPPWRSAMDCSCTGSPSTPSLTCAAA